VLVLAALPLRCKALCPLIQLCWRAREGDALLVHVRNLQAPTEVVG
jgi:hypothetical protein